MANTKISQLPSYTGTAADLRWFVMNNSGETETFKYSGFTSQLVPGTGTDSFETIGSTASTANSIVIGKNSYVANGDNQIFIGNNIQSSSVGTREKNVIIGSILGATKPENSNAIVGYDNTPGGGYNNNILGINNVGNGHSSVVGSNNTAGFIGTTIGLANTAGQQSVAIGHSNTAGGGISIAIGQGNTDASNNRVIAIGGSNSISSAWSVGLGYSNTLIGFNYSTESVLIGYGNTINGTAVGTGNVNIGQSQTISDGSYNTILNGKSNALQGGLYNNIFNGSGNTISSSYSGVSMLNCFGRTADASNTTYVENLRVFRQAQYGNFNNGSRATNYTIDWNNGNIQKVVLTGSCVFSATNITDGTTYIFKVEQDNSGNRAATWSSGIFKFANGTPPTLSTGANDVDIFTFVAMDGLLYGVAQLNFG